MAPLPRTVPFMQVLRTTYLRGRGPQRTRRVILITFNDAITVSDVYETGTGFKQGNETGTPATAQPMNLSQVIPETIRDAIVRIVPPTILLSGSFGAPLANLFAVSSQTQVDVVSFNPSTGILIIKVVGAQVSTTGPVKEPATPIGGVKVAGTLVFEIEYTSNR